MSTPNARISRGTRLLLRFYPETRFGGFTSVDGTVSFYFRVHALTNSDSVVLDVGCGRGEYQDDPVTPRRELRIFKSKVRRVIGIDVDDAGESNPYLDQFRKIVGDRWPIEDASVDVCVCDFVLEHILDADAFFREVSRILRNGGYFCARTPNARGYVAWISRLVPNHLHAEVIAKVQDRRTEEDVFPTVYRCNSIGQLRRQLTRHGFEHHVTTQMAEPSYFNFSSVAYFLGSVFHRYAPQWCGTTIFAFARKVEPSSEAAAN